MHKLIKWCTAFILLVSCMLVACGGGSSSGTTQPSPSPALPSTPIAAQIQGKVLNVAGQPVVGATVSSGTAQTVSAADGSYVIQTTGNTDLVVVLVKKAGFATLAKQAPTAPGKITSLELTLQADQVNSTFNATSGVTVLPNGASVQIPANAIRTSSGLTYTGTVNIAASYYSPDTMLGEQNFAQPYSGTNNGVASLLQSVGFIEVKLTDIAGAPLQLSTASAATLTFPASSVSAGAAAIPLWYYDEVAATWVREGQTTKQADGSYQGTVNHFTIWNCDQAFNGPLQATLKACFQDAAGRPADFLLARVRSRGWSGSGSAAGGQLQTQVISGQQLELISLQSPPRFSPVAITPLVPGEVRQLPCITVASSSVDAFAGFSSNLANLITLLSPVTPVTPAAPVTLIAPVVPVTPVAPVVPVTPVAPVVPVTPVAPVIPVTPVAPVVPVTPVAPVAPTTAAYAGAYAGTYSGGEVGTFNINIATNGTITGGGVSTTFNNLRFTISGTVSSSGAVTINAAAGTAGEATFVGTINAATGAVGGTWSRPGASGVFTGNRI